MREGFETEGIRRKEDYKNLEDKMVLKMEEGSKKERHARQQVPHETAQGFFMKKMQDSRFKRSWLS